MQVGCEECEEGGDGVRPRTAPLEDVVGNMFTRAHFANTHRTVRGEEEVSDLWRGLRGGGSDTEVRVVRREGGDTTEARQLDGVVADGMGCGADIT